MSLRKKIVLLFALTFVALVVLLNLVSWFFILGGYRDLEEREARRNLARAADAVWGEVDNLDLVVRDWAFWDDTYSFIAEPYEAYIEANLTESSFVHIRVQFMVFLDREGRVVYAKGVDLELEREMPVPAGLFAHLSSDCPLLQPMESGEGVSGLLLLPEGPFLISSEPILTSDAKGPPRGVLIMGRLLDREEARRIIAPHHLNVDLRAVGGGNESDDWSQAEGLLLAGEEAVLQTQGSSSMRGYILLQDLYGNPALVLRVTMDRDIYQQGINTLMYSVFFLTFSCLAIFAITLALLEKAFLRRMARLSEEIAGIGKAGDPSLRLSISGNDEISGLAHSVNEMMDRLEEEERRFRSLIENALDIILLLDREGVITYQSPSTERVLLYGKEELLGRSVFDFIHPDDRERARHVFERALDEPGSLGRYEIRFRKGEGSWCRLEIIGYNLLHDPAVGGVVVNARDITERVEARERLEKINRLFVSMGADIMENIERIVFACRDILAVPFAAYSRAEKGRLVVISTAPGEEGFRIINRPQGCFFFDHIEENSREPVILRDQEAVSHCRLCPVASLDNCGFCAGYPVVCKEKTVGFLSVFDNRAGNLSGDEMEILGTLARALSVEEERLAHERELKDFIDIASHELRHPVTLMKGYAITLRDYGERMDPVMQRELLEIINRGADRLDLLINELLDVSRIERGRLDLNRREARLEPIIHRAVSEIEAKGHRGRFRVTLAPGLSPHRIDPEKILRVLIILLDNAVNFSPPETPVEIYVEEINGQVRVSVCDRGPGIPEKDRERIFERFYQVEDVLHHSKSGMGMGLYIAREIVEAHEGRIWHEPRPGGGSVFRFTLN